VCCACVCVVGVDTRCAVCVCVCVCVLGVDTRCAACAVVTKMIHMYILKANRTFQKVSTAILYIAKLKTNKRVVTQRHFTN
jgi:hypothetical protein